MYRCVQHYVIQCWSKALPKAFAWHYLRCVLLLSRCSCQVNCAVAIARQCPYETSATVCSRMSGRERSLRQLSHRKDYVSPIKYHWFSYIYPANIFTTMRLYYQCIISVSSIYISSGSDLHLLVKDRKGRYAKFEAMEVTESALPLGKPETQFSWWYYTSVANQTNDTLRDCKISKSLFDLVFLNWENCTTFIAIGAHYQLKRNMLSMLWYVQNNRNWKKYLRDRQVKHSAWAAI